MSEIYSDTSLPPAYYLVAPDTKDPHILLQQTEALLYACQVAGSSLSLSAAADLLAQMENPSDPQLRLRQQLCWAEIGTIDAIVSRSDSSFDAALAAWHDLAAQPSDYSEVTQQRVIRALGSLGQNLLRSGRAGRFELLRSSLLEENTQTKSAFSALARIALDRVTE